MSTGDGFTVHLEALYNAAVSLQRILGEVDSQPVGSLACPPQVVGHDELATAGTEFCRRWQLGVNNLLNDGSLIAEGMYSCLKEYSTQDQTVARVFNDLYSN
jgi:hypothetical protein